jgi:CRISPR/Cas system-associated exonuclease Cas4 (RecB family)
MTAHSYSSINTFRNCPKQYEALYILKSVPRSTSEAMQRGIEIHSHLERLVKGWPSECAHEIKIPDGYDPAGLKERGAAAEVELAISRGGGRLSFFDDLVFLRGKVDAMWVEDGVVQVVDWKSGKYYPDEFQANVYAHLIRTAAGSARIPVRFHWVFVAKEEGRARTIDVDQHASHRVLSAIEAVEKAELFPAKPNPLCRFCPVVFCRYNPMFGAEEE